MKQLLSAFFMLLLAASLHSQEKIDFNHYQPLKCVGIIPQDFLMLSQDKYKADVKNEVKLAKNHHITSDKQDFLLQTNYLIDEILLSGKVLFGDTVTNYVNRVADNVLAGQPELRSKLRFYCLKSSEVNAFTTNQGVIFVTLGLIAQLENEAQLAFILSHEIAHYERHHSMK
jgi:Zn-dependent protease with chaperone function